MGRRPEPSIAAAAGPSPFTARGLNRMNSAAYVGVSPSYFDEMVRDGRMPQPKMAGSRILWDRVKLDAYFNALPERDGKAPEDVDSWADWQ